MKVLPLHPRPQMTRDRWIDLGGRWHFAFDDADVGLRENWVERAEMFDRVITVPFPRSRRRAASLAARRIVSSGIAARFGSRRPIALAASCFISVRSITGPMSGSTARWSPSTRTGKRPFPPISAAS